MSVANPPFIGPYPLPSDYIRVIRADGSDYFTGATQLTGQATTVYSFGAVGDGKADDTAAINAGIAWSAANNRVLVIPAGTYLHKSMILAVSGAHVVAADDATLVRGFGSAGLLGALGQADYTTKIVNFSWTGGKLTSPTTTAFNGNMVSLWGDYMEFDSLTVDTFGGVNGRGFLLGGNHNRMWKCKVLNPNRVVAVGGVRFYAGEDFICMGAQAESGDDVFQLVVAAGGLHGDQSITNAWFIACSGTSYQARLIVAGIVDQNQAAGVQSLTASITNSGWIVVTGAAGARAALIENKNSSGTIANITIQDCILDGSDADLNASVYIWGATSGGVRNVTFRSVVVKAPNRHGLISIGNVSGLYWEGGEIEASTGGSSYFTVLLKNLKKGRFSGCTLNASGNEAATVGPGNDNTLQCWGVVFDEVTFVGIQDGQYGTNFRYANGCTAKFCTFIPAAGSTTAKAVLLSAFASGCTVNDNDDTALPGTTNFALTTGHGHAMYRNWKDTRTFWSLNGTQPIAPPVITGSRASGAAYTNLLSALATLGEVVDNSTA